MDNHSDSTVVGPSLVPKLEILRGAGAGSKISLKFKTRLGREADNDVVLADPRVSRYHCQITFEDGKWLLTDLGSANGTLLDGLPVSVPQPLSHGSQVQVGETILAFVDPMDEKEHPINPSMTIIGGKIPPIAKPKSAPAASDSGNVPRMVWIAGGLILILMLAVAGIVLWQGKTPAAPPVAVQPPESTPAATQIAAPIAEPPLALKFEDDFSDSSSGWDDAFSKDYTKQYGNNQYHIEITTNNLVVWGLSNRNAADFEIEVEVSLQDSEPGNTYGLIFRYVDHNNYYRFDVSDDGYFLLSKFEAGEWQTLINWTPSAAIKQGQTSNILKIAAFGPEIAVFANGQELGRITDDTFQAGNFGFFASTFNGPHIWVSYDNLKLRTPAEQQIAVIPTIAATRPAPSDARLPDAPTPTPKTEGDTLPATPDVAEPAAPQPQTFAITATQTSTVTAEPPPVPPVETPAPLPDFVTRDQPPARGESQLPGKFIFPVYDAARGTYDIFRANTDGSEREQLFAAAGQPAANKTGNTIAYRSWQADKRGLIVQELGQADYWLFEPYFEAAAPVFSPNDDFFVYHSRAGRDTPALYRTLGTESQVLRRESIPIEGEMPAFTPDGRLVYKGCLNNACGLILTNLDGGAPQQLTNTPGDTAPAVSPDGATVAFMSNRDGDWEIYTVGLDGQNLQRLTTAPGGDGLPVWSPDGSRLAFVSNRDGFSAIWVMTPTGRRPHQLFALNGSIDGIVQVDTAHSFGWLEERIVWTP